MKKDAGLYLVHIIECLEKIEQYTKNGKDAFFESSLIQDAVYRNFEIIGEAAKRVPDIVRSKASDLPWRQIAGFRDVLIHQYDGVDPDEVWKIIEHNLPGWKDRIRAILNDLEKTNK
jgi:uncharacterized protein with HEPN domain